MTHNQLQWSEGYTWDPAEGYVEVTQERPIPVKPVAPTVIPVEVIEREMTVAL